MSWEHFHIYASLSTVLCLTGAIFALRSKNRPSRIAVAATAMGILVLAVFITGLWYTLTRPPLRTMGETRLWYSFFVGVAGLLVYRRWHYRFVLPFTCILAGVFNIMNILKPEIHDQTLVPALQSIWFIPHVSIYMFAYGILACTFLLAVAGLFNKKCLYFEPLDNLVYIGTGLLFLGLITGAVWAKQAWGNFWEWDPKETWAAMTCAVYLVYIHLRFTRLSKSRLLYAVVIAGFILLQMCWYGYQYLPASQGSMHIY